MLSSFDAWITEPPTNPNPDTTQTDEVCDYCGDGMVEDENERLWCIACEEEYAAERKAEERADWEQYGDWTLIL